MQTTQFKADDRLQKTWIPEGTEEYKHFKITTLENDFLASYLNKKFKLKPNELLLDVGGREGDIAVKLQKPKSIHLVDPDPTLILPFKPAKYWNEKVQNLDLSADKYKLIICSHVLGYFGTQNVQDQVFRNLLTLLDDGGTLVLFYNRNIDYMADLLAFSKENLDPGHYDYFNEKLLRELDKNNYTIKTDDVSFELNYESFKDLARCCWFLFGAMDQNIEEVSKKFISKLKKDLKRPLFAIDERVVLITKQSA